MCNIYNDNWNDFIVSITADSYLVTGIAPPIDLYYRRVGGGVLIPGRRILCPSELVLIPPFLLANYNRYPLTDASITPPTGFAPDYPIVASRIIVDIKIGDNTYAYLVRVSYLSGVNNLALLQVDDTHPFNIGTPNIPDSGFILSKGVSIGDKIRVIGYTNSNNNSYGAMEAISDNDGTVSLDYYMDPSGWIHSQLILLSVSGVYNNQVGSAVVGDYNRLIGIVITAPTGTVRFGENDNSANSGFIQAGLPHINTIGEGRVAAIHYCEIQQFLNAVDNQYPLEAVDDIVNGTWERVLVGYMGIGYRQFKSTDYVDNIDFDGSVTGVPGYEYPVDIDDNEGKPDKIVNGILVTSIAGDSTSLPSHLSPGTPQQASGDYPIILPNSPLLGILNPGDKIISLSYNRVDEDVDITQLVGGRSREVAPSLILSRLAPGDTVIVRHSNSTTNPKFNTEDESSIMLINMPPFLDFPYHAWHRCPLVNPLPQGFEPPI